MKVETTVTYDDGKTRSLAFELGAKPAHDDMLRVGETIGRAMVVDSSRKRRRPTILEHGLGSERHARTGKLWTQYDCPSCFFHSAAEGAYVSAPSLPPELRDVAAWKQAADAKDASEQFDRDKARALRIFDAHVCGAPTT